MRIERERDREREPPVVCRNKIRNDRSGRTIETD